MKDEAEEFDEKPIKKKDGKIDFKKEHKAILKELKRLGLRD